MEMRRTPWAFGRFSERDWWALRQSKRFRKSVIYRRTYDKLSAWFLSLGDAFVGEVVKLHPKV
jgi:hypothetical protein